MESNSVNNHTSDNRESDLFITSMITDRIGQHEVLLPINHKNYNFREKKNTKVWKFKIYIKSFYTVAMVIETKVVIGWFELQQNNNNNNNNNKNNNTE